MFWYQVAIFSYGSVFWLQESGHVCLGEPGDGAHLRKGAIENEPKWELEKIDLKSMLVRIVKNENVAWYLRGCSQFPLHFVIYHFTLVYVPRLF